MNIITRNHSTDIAISQLTTIASAGAKHLSDHGRDPSGILVPRATIESIAWRAY